MRRPIFDGKEQLASTSLYTTTRTWRLFSYLSRPSRFEPLQTKNSFGVAFDTDGVVKQLRLQMVLSKSSVLRKEFMIATTNLLNGISQANIGKF
jgi:hypothetical protein